MAPHIKVRKLLYYYLHNDWDLTNPVASAWWKTCWCHFLKLVWPLEVSSLTFIPLCGSCLWKKRLLLSSCFPLHSPVVAVVADPGPRSVMSGWVAPSAHRAVGVTSDTAVCDGGAQSQTSEESEVWSRPRALFPGTTPVFSLTQRQGGDVMSSYIKHLPGCARARARTDSSIGYRFYRFAIFSLRCIKFIDIQRWKLYCKLLKGQLSNCAHFKKTLESSPTHGNLM